MNMTEPEVEELERAAEWRARLADADPGDGGSVAAAALLQRLADDLRRNDYASLWTELRSIGNWLGESDAISDYADFARLPGADRDYRAARRRGCLSGRFAGDCEGIFVG